MRALSIAFLALALAQLSMASVMITKRDSKPYMEYDPATISGCTYWYDNYEGFSCAEVRSWYNISAETFSRWNPSITLDCGNWQEISYCVQVLSESPTSTSAPVTSTSTTTATTQTPRPTPSWQHLGCYLDSGTVPTLSNQSAEASGSGFLTISDCQSSCWARDFIYAGVEAGDECWCSVFIANIFAPNASECNMPCSGNPSEICGGESRINVYKAVTTTSPITSTTTSTTSTSTSTSSAATNTSSPPTLTSTSSTTTASLTSTSSAIPSESVCVSGAVAPGMSGNYIGLCQYACGYGYCPPGPCQCSQYGSPVAPPATNGRDGCPASGLDDSYKGLCSFACTRGYCPEGACVYC